MGVLDEQAGNWMVICEDGDSIRYADRHFDSTATFYKSVFVNENTVSNKRRLRVEFTTRLKIRQLLAKRVTLRLSYPPLFG